jgi:hypothetical protein
MSRNLRLLPNQNESKRYLVLAEEYGKSADLIYRMIRSATEATLQRFRSIRSVLLLWNLVKIGLGLTGRSGLRVGQNEQWYAILPVLKKYSHNTALSLIAVLRGKSKTIRLRQPVESRH